MTLNLRDGSLWEGISEICKKKNKASLMHVCHYYMINFIKIMLHEYEKNLIYYL